MVDLYLTQIDSFELVTLTPVIDEELQVKVSEALTRRLKKEFNFKLLRQAFEFKLELAYDEFEQQIKAHVTHHPKDLCAVGELIACGVLDRNSFEFFMNQDSCAYFLTHYEQMEQPPLESDWFWQLSRDIHQRLAKTHHYQAIKQALIQKIRTKVAAPELIDLYFDLYHH